jgi:hypothetical protein
VRSELQRHDLLAGETSGRCDAHHIHSGSRRPNSISRSWPWCRCGGRRWPIMRSCWPRGSSMTSSIGAMRSATRWETAPCRCASSVSSIDPQRTKLGAERGRSVRRGLQPTRRMITLTHRRAMIVISCQADGVGLGTWPAPPRCVLPGPTVRAARCHSVRAGLPHAIAVGTRQLRTGRRAPWGASVRTPCLDARAHHRGLCRA